MAKVTIREVAKEAGVSISTVSNALNNVETINKDTKQKVLEAVEKLHYVPNLTGRFLKTGESRTLGFFTNTLSGPYFNVLVEAMCKEADEKGYSILIFVSKNIQDVLTNIMGRNLEGVFIFEDEGFDESELSTLKAYGIPALFLDRIIHEEHMASLVFDSYRDGYEATRYLIDKGHKNIGFIEGAPTMYDSSERYRGYLDALADAGLEYDDLNKFTCYFKEDIAYDTFKKAVASKAFVCPDAFVAGNDQSAIGCMRALKEAGYRIPEDVGVVSFDDQPVSQYFDPPITTVRNPMALQGEKAVDMLLKMIAGDEVPSETLKGELIVRMSS